MFKYSIPHMLASVRATNPSFRDFDVILTKTRERIDNPSLIVAGDMFGYHPEYVYVERWSSEGMHMMAVTVTEDSKKLKIIPAVLRREHIKDDFCDEQGHVKFEYKGNNLSALYRVLSLYNQSINKKP